MGLSVAVNLPMKPPKNYHYILNTTLHHKRQELRPHLSDGVCEALCTQKSPPVAVNHEFLAGFVAGGNSAPTDSKMHLSASS